MELEGVLAAAVTAEEWQMIPAEVGKKIASFVNEECEKFITAKALFETNRFNFEQQIKDLQDQYANTTAENERYLQKNLVMEKSLTELQNQISMLTKDNSLLQTKCNKLDTETADYKNQRNEAIDERDRLISLLQTRDTELERLRTEMASLNKQLDSAVKAKCEALAEAQAVDSMKLTLEYREKRMEHEKAMLREQLKSVTDELNVRTNELLNMRRDNTTRCVQLEAKVTEYSQEMMNLKAQVKSFTDINKNLVAKHEELSKKLLTQRELESKMNDSYLQELDAKTKMANLYQSMCEESQQHAEELKSALAEVQELLKTASEKYGELETKHKETTLAHEEIIAKKNDCISMLKKELETANDLIENVKVDQIQRDLEEMSPTAAAASRYLKSGMTITEIYSQYVAVSEKFAAKEEECHRLNNFIAGIIKEIDEKGPLVNKLKNDYSNLLDANDELKTNNELMLNELQQLRDANAELRRLQGVTSRENSRLKKEVADLSRQVCHLLQEVENSRVGSSSTSTDMDLSDSVSSADIIAKKLVTFNDISELQSQNQKLLACIRELTERQEEAEAIDPIDIANLKTKLDNLRESQNELLEERDRQNKLLATLRSQRDMFQNLYNQAIKASGEEVPTQLERSFYPENKEPNKTQTDAETQSDGKVKELENQVDSLNKQIEILNKESETYRNEKHANEKMLLEQIETLSKEVRDLTKINCKLTSQAEINDEKFKIMQNNTEVFKKQIAALENQNRHYSESLVKHETTIIYIKDEIIAAQTRASQAEVRAANLEKENALLHEVEKRLSKENEIIKRQLHQQNVMQSNIELIKATLERNDAEEKIRAESRLDEAHRECSALRRRLQEEQDRFRELSEHLERQVKTAEERMLEEKRQADKLRDDLAASREDLIKQAAKIEDLTSKIKLTAYELPATSEEGRKIRELEEMNSECRIEIESLKSKLKTAKEASDQYYNVAQASEELCKNEREMNEKLKSELKIQEIKIKELEEKCQELQGELSIQMDDQDIANAGIKSKSNKLEEELNTTAMDLNTAREQLEIVRSENKALTEQLKATENKYAREVTLHSVDLQSLTSMKEELEKVLGESKELMSTKQQALDALKENKESWEKQEAMFKKEYEQISNRLKDAESQNSLLLDQIETLNTQMSILQTHIGSGDQGNTSIGDVSFNRSYTEDEAKSSEQLLKIIKYLRQEKDIAISRADIVDAEHQRLKTQFELLTKQYDDMKRLVETERQETEISMVSSIKHAEILRKLETLNAITDSNRALRHERDQLITQLEDLKVRISKLETDSSPLEEKCKELQTKADQMQNENIALRTEATRWRQRANMLIEKTNRTSPEDWKKLQNERENLAKQLTIERSTTTKLNEENNCLRHDKQKLEEQLKNLRGQNNNQSEEIAKLKEEMSALQSQIQQISDNLTQCNENNRKITEENSALTEETANKDAAINDLKNNLTQIRKIAKKYKIQSEDQLKEIEQLKGEKAALETNINDGAEKRDQLLEEQRSGLEQRLVSMEEEHKDNVEQLTQELRSVREEIENIRKENESLKQLGIEKEERFKTLFKNAKERIVQLTEQNSNLKDAINRDKPESDSAGEGSSKYSELVEKLSKLQREKDDIIQEKQREKEKHVMELESLNQRIGQLQRQQGSLQGSKPTTSSTTSEKSMVEPPTANIKPMAGHSTNTQTQSVPIPPWRSGGEPPLASIRPMSAQFRTVAVLPTSQSPSAVMVPPQQQVHTTGSSNIEAALSSSPTSSHTDYAPATSSASSASSHCAGSGGGPRQLAVPPTQSSQEAEAVDDDGGVQTAGPATSASPSSQCSAQQQAVALVLPRVEPPAAAGSGQAEQGGQSSSGGSPGASGGGSSNAVTTTQAGLKRQRDADPDGSQSDDQSKQQQSKRTRIQQTGTVSDSGLDVEYQVPTSSQRDHDDDNVIVVESDEDGGADEGEGAEDDQDDPDTEGYEMEGMEQDNYEEADCQDVEEDEEGGNEVEVIEDSSEVPNQSEGQNQEEEMGEQAQSEAISSGTDGSGLMSVTLSQASTSTSATMPSQSRTRHVIPLSSSRQPQLHHHQQQQLLLPHGLEDVGDDGIVPSTPTLFVPRRSDGFGEAVSSPQVPTSGGRLFTFGEPSHHAAGSSEAVPEQTLEVVGNTDDNSTGRSVPSTPLQSSPQESVPGVDEAAGSNNSSHSDVSKGENCSKSLGK
ncbi:nucleoprotein TPR isoform X3 [Aethina tumida]|uniref:nucleoprotein TPR isoform X3 n=1 Tax=Aethina tumida TaxID=116153 RepID=UPI0021473B8E|nr:nucleoprotein TPR isoform X3 [Aethina tumida]